MFDGKLSAMLENIPGGVHQFLNDEYFTLVSMSKGFCGMLGYTRGEIETRFQSRYLEMIHPGDRATVLNGLEEQRLTLGAEQELEYRVLHKSGESLWVLDRVRRAAARDGTELLTSVLIEITDRKREQEELRLSLERHKIIMDQTTDIIFEWDIAADTLVFSPNWRKKFGYDAIHSQISKNIPLSQNIHAEDIPAFVAIMRDTAGGKPYSETEFRIRSAHGWYTWCRIRATAQYDEENHPIKAVGVVIDIDAEKRQKDVLLELAQKDALTGLYNKKTIQTMVEEKCRVSHRLDYQMMMIIDVDYFKEVNDTYGHMCGDSLLAELAAALGGLVQSAGLVGRIGGDEFLVYLPEISDEAAAVEEAEKTLAALGNIRPAPEKPPVSCSIGIALLPARGGDFFAMYQCADRALYHIKATGRNGFAFYTPALCGDSVPCGLARSAVGEIVDSEIASPVEETLAKYTFEMLYNAVDVETTVSRILETVGRAYAVSRAYIFESSEDGLYCSNTFEWCNEGIPSEIEALQHLSYKEDLGDYLQNFDEKGVFYCPDIRKLKAPLYAVLAPQGIDSLLQCAILDDGRFKGYVGFDECSGHRYWTKEQISSLTLAANVLSTFLVKQRLKERLGIR